MLFKLLSLAKFIIASSADKNFFFWAALLTLNRKQFWISSQQSLTCLVDRSLALSDSKSLTKFFALCKNEKKMVLVSFVAHHFTSHHIASHHTPPTHLRNQHHLLKQLQQPRIRILELAVEENLRVLCVGNLLQNGHELRVFDKRVLPLFVREQQLQGLRFHALVDEVALLCKLHEHSHPKTLNIPPRSHAAIVPEQALDFGLVGRIFEVGCVVEDLAHYL